MNNNLLILLMNINNDDDDGDGDNNNNNEWYIQEVAWFELYGFLCTFHEKHI